MALSCIVSDMLNVNNDVALFDLKILVRGHLRCEFLHVELQTPGAIFLLLIAWIYLYSCLHRELRKRLYSVG